VKEADGMASSGAAENGGFRTGTVRRDFVRIAASLLLFGVTFGLIEAAVVIDLRVLFEPSNGAGATAVPTGEGFPVLTVSQLLRGSDQASRLLRIEMIREAATIALLATAGLAVGGRTLRVFAAFLTAFGVWDLAYYAAFRCLTGWPATVWAWDLLFLLPVCWSGPVLAPMIVAATMVVCGLHTIARDLSGKPLRPGPGHWLAVLGGGFVIIAAFCANARVVAEGGVPTEFPWGIFQFGELVAVTGYAAAASR
jgi:hypothetical protein